MACCSAGILQLAAQNKPIEKTDVEVNKQNTEIIHISLDCRALMLAMVYLQLVCFYGQ
jgi:hypothetical protein